jgi:hypothetical protein
MTATAPQRDLEAMTALARQRQNRRLLVVAVAVPMLSLVTALTMLAIQRPGLRLSPLTFLIILAFVAVGPVFGVVLVQVARRRGATWVQPSPFLALDWRNRRRLLRAMRRCEPIAPADLPVAAHLAAQIRRTRWTPVMCTAPMLVQAIYIGRPGFLGQFAIAAVAAGICLAGWLFYVHHKIASRTDI